MIRVIDLYKYDKHTEFGMFDASAPFLKQVCELNINGNVIVMRGLGKTLNRNVPHKA